jgi:tripartite-type tricarboxylate transporter receptor subunit TctC
MMRTLCIVVVCAGLGIAFNTAGASAQQFPTKPVRIVTPFGAGSGPDAVLRVVGEKLTRHWGQQVVVENRPGGNGFIAIEAAKKAPSDGYTLVQMDDTHMALQPHLYKKMPYDIAKDFEPVATLFRTYFFVVVPSDSKWQNMKDLIEAAKAKPGDLTYGSWFIGSPGHVGAAMLEASTGTQMVHIPYKESSQLYTAVGNNEVSWAFGSAASSGPMYRARKVRYIAVAKRQRLEGYPEVPTMAEAGGPADLEVRAWVALLAPRGTPANVVAKINEDIQKLLAESDVRERFTTFGFEPYAAPASEVTKERESDFQRYGEIVKRAKISIE